MKSPTKTALICFAVIVRTATTAVLLIALLFAYTDLEFRLRFYRPWTPSAAKESIQGESGEFGTSDNPALIALGHVLADGAGILERDDYHWLLYTPDRSVRLQGYLCGDKEPRAYGWIFALDMTSFYAARLHSGYWETGRFKPGSFMKAMASSVVFSPTGRSLHFDGYITYGMGRGSERAFTEAGAPDFTAALTASLHLISETAPGIYRLALGVADENSYRYERYEAYSSYLEWSQTQGYLAFVLGAQPFIEGRLKPEKLEGWEYDAQANTLTKRITL